MATLTFRDRFTVPAPPERTFAVLTDPSRLADWQRQVVEVHHDDDPLRTGSRLVEVRRGPLGKRLEQTVEVVALEPPGRFALRVVDGPVPLDGDWRLAPAGDGGTEVTFTASGQAPAPLRLVKPLLRRQMAAHHRRLRELLAPPAGRRPSPRR